MVKDTNRDEGDKDFYSSSAFTDVPKGHIRLAECGNRKNFPDSSYRD